MSELPALEEIHDAGNRNCDPVGILFTEKIVIVVNLIKRNKSTQFGSNPPNLYQIHPICIKSTQFVSNPPNLYQIHTICIKSTQFESNPPILSTSNETQFSPSQKNFLFTGTQLTHLSVFALYCIMLLTLWSTKCSLLSPTPAPPPHPRGRVHV